MNSFGAKLGIFIIVLGVAITFVSKFLSPLFSFLSGLIGIIVIVSGMFIFLASEKEN